LLDAVSYLSLSYVVALDNDALKKGKGAGLQVQSEITGIHLEWFELDNCQFQQQRLETSFYHDTQTGHKVWSILGGSPRHQRPHNLDKTVKDALTV
jgi:hypothetical protein